MTTLLVIEHNGSELGATTRSILRACAQIDPSSGPDTLVLGEGIGEVAAKAAALPGVGKVLACDGPALAGKLGEACGGAVAEAAKSYTHVVMASGTFSKSVLPRAAALCDSQMLTDVIGVSDASTFMRPIYAGNAVATVVMSDPVKFLSVRGVAFEPVEGGRDGDPAPVEALEPPADAGLAKLQETRKGEQDRPDLTVAKIVVSGGRGVGSAENFAAVERVAEKLNAAVGASRAAVDAGYAPNDLQVGQTGKIVAPDLYIAVGISGAIQHLAGMKDSKVIVAINKDPDAPIFEVADYGLVGDLLPALQELEQALS